MLYASVLLGAAVAMRTLSAPIVTPVTPLKFFPNSAVSSICCSAVPTAAAVKLVSMLPGSGSRGQGCKQRGSSLVGMAPAAAAHQAGPVSNLSGPGFGSAQQY